MKKAGVDANIESYSWDITTVYDRSLARKLFSLAFVEAHSSVLIFGPTGAGYDKYLVELNRLITL